jgi:uncharacterized protein YdiU (UPF0061 family)
MSGMAGTPSSSPNRPSQGWRLEHSYSQLPQPLHRAWNPTPAADPRLVIFNQGLAADLGLDADALQHPETAGLFTGNILPEGARPIAQAYAGHQFGHFNILGDGRALLLGEQITPAGQKCDIQLKGAGATPFSRGGDGRAALGPMLREYLISEAMFALGIPTTRSLAVAATGQPVHRQETLPGAVLTRIAASHIRVGTFEWAAAHGDPELLSTLVDYSVSRHYPERQATGNAALALLEGAMDRQAALVARWMQLGFIHGVMNTDNMALSGETIDYGPCAFMDRHHPDTVFSSIDRHGRYAYGRQPEIAQWNLARLAECLLPLLDPLPARALDLANELISSFPGRFKSQWLTGYRAKLGLFTEEPEDATLVQELIEWMEHSESDHTQTFLALSAPGAVVTAPCQDRLFSTWHSQWLARLLRQDASPAAARALMLKHNPAVIPRNEHVEAALQAATTEGDFAPFYRLVEVLAAPFNHDLARPAEYLRPPPKTAPPYKTFCGT